MNRENLITVEDVIKAQQGCQEAMESIFVNFKNYIYLIQSKYYAIGYDVDDLVQEGYLGLLKAVNNFDKDKQASFKTFANLCIKRQIYSLIRHTQMHKNKALNSCQLDNMYDSDGEEYKCNNPISTTIIYTPEDILMSKEKIEEMFKFASLNLSKYERVVVDLLYKEYDYNEIAAILKQTPKKIDNAIQRIRNKYKAYNV